MIYTIWVQDCPQSNWKLLDNQWGNSKLTGTLKGYKKQSQNGMNWIDLYFQGNVFQYLFIKFVLHRHAPVIKGWHVDFIKEYEEKS